jgi:PAS domain S-box-containing protein
MILPFLPIRAVDFFGSILMIVFSLLCLGPARRLRRKDPNNLIWTYLLWFCYMLATFAVSRSAGHILKQILEVTGNRPAWETIRPFSGAINTFTLVGAAAITLFFERTWKVYQEIMRDRRALQAAHEELLYLNSNLETLVGERTAAMTLSQHRYRRIFEISKDMILVTEKSGSVIDVNPAGFKMLGFEKADFFSSERSIREFLSESDWISVRKAVLEAGYIASTEVDLRRSDGTNIRALLTASLDRGASGEEETVHFLIKDIEQIRLMERQIGQADKLASIGQLSAGIAHEINNPLGIILGYTQLMLREENPEKERYADLKTIEKHVRNCKGIVEDLLKFARSSKPEKEAVKINQVIDDVLHFVRHRAELDHVEVVKEYDPRIPQLLLDEKKIRQVFMNLIMNAKHAVARNGIIRIITGVEPSGDRVFVKVSDTGYGIEEGNLTRIFDPFFTTKPTGEGTGLGLSVSYGIIKNHGGDIRVESEPGKGSTFTVTLPIHQPAVIAQPPSHEGTKKAYEI